MSLHSVIHRSVQVVALVLVAAAPGEGNWTSGAWTLDGVDGWVLQDASLALTAADDPVIAYGGSSLRLLSWDGSGWVREQVDFAPTSCGRIDDVSLALDRNDDPAISYYVDVADGDDELRFARWDGTAWSVETVDRGFRVGQHTSLALTAAADNPSISYGDRGRFALKPARHDGTAWSVEEVAASFGGTSLRLDGSDNPHISHVGDDSNARYTRWDGTAWTSDVFGNAEGVTSLAFDTAGNPAVAYLTIRAIWLARFDGTAWTIEDAGPAGFTQKHGVSLAFDRADTPHISYSNSFLVEYARRVGVDWLAEPLNTQGLRTSIALDSSGQPRIANEGFGDPLVSFSRRNGIADWDVQAGIDRGDDGTVGTYSSVALDAAGRPSVAYVGSADELKFASWDGAGWSIETVDTGGDVVRWVSLARDGADDPAIAYYDAGAGDLRLAAWDGTAWTVRSVHGIGDVGAHAALVFDSAGGAHLSYHDAGNGDLVYARPAGPSWSIEVVDPGPGAGTWSALALDAAERASISYYDAVDRDLRVARWDGAAWSRETVDSDGDVGLHTSLALDAAGDPVVSYHDATAGSLKVARWDGSAWSRETVDPGLAIAPEGWTSIALDAADRPVVAHAETFAVRLARWDGAGWWSEEVGRREFSFDGHRGGLVLATAGEPVVAYDSACRPQMIVARRMPVPAELHRGLVADLSPGWRALALPLTPANDDETPPFPVPTSLRGREDDTPQPAPLVLYRLLVGGADAGNSLRVVKTSPAGDVQVSH